MHHPHWVVAELRRDLPQTILPYCTPVLRVRGVSSDKSIRKCGGSSSSNSRTVGPSDFWGALLAVYNIIESSIDRRPVIIASKSIRHSFSSCRCVVLRSADVLKDLQPLQASSSLIPAPFSTGGRTPFVTADNTGPLSTPAC